MFHPLTTLAVAVLFFVLTPGVLLSLPRGGSKYVVAAVHAVVFGLVFHLIHKSLMKFGQQYERFEDAPLACTPPGQKPAEGSSCCIGDVQESGMC
jgi:hypothetical protein